MVQATVTFSASHAPSPLVAYRSSSPHCLLLRVYLNTRFPAISSPYSTAALAAKYLHDQGYSRHQLLSCIRSIIDIPARLQGPSSNVTFRIPIFQPASPGKCPSCDQIFGPTTISLGSSNVTWRRGLARTWLLTIDSRCCRKQCSIWDMG
jgi:hypothetical protein